MSINIQKIDRDTYLFKSNSGKEYFIDMEEFNGNGRCGCRDFECRHLPKLQKLQDQGITSFPEYACKHIHHLRNVLEGKTKLAAQRPNKGGETS